MSPWSPSLCVSQSVLPLPAHSLSLSLCPPACIIGMRQAALLQGSKVINVLQMFLWAMTDWGIIPTSHVSLPYSSFSFTSYAYPSLLHCLSYSIFSPPFISSSFVLSLHTFALFLTPSPPCFVIYPPTLFFCLFSCPCVCLQLSLLPFLTMSGMRFELYFCYLFSKLDALLFHIASPGNI